MQQPFEYVGIMLFGTEKAEAFRATDNGLRVAKDDLLCFQVPPQDPEGKDGVEDGELALVATENERHIGLVLFEGNDIHMQLIAARSRTITVPGDECKGISKLAAHYTLAN